MINKQGELRNMCFSTEWFELMIDNKPCSSLFSGASPESKRRKTKLSTVLQSFYLKTILKCNRHYDSITFLATVCHAEFLSSAYYAAIIFSPLNVLSLLPCFFSWLLIFKLSTSRLFLGCYAKLNRVPI